MSYCVRCVNGRVKYLFLLLSFFIFFFFGLHHENYLKPIKQKQKKKLSKKINLRSFPLPAALINILWRFSPWTINKNKRFFFWFFIAGIVLVNVESQPDITKKLIGMLASDKLPHYAGIIKQKSCCLRPWQTNTPPQYVSDSQAHQKSNDKFEFYDYVWVVSWDEIVARVTSLFQ
jgi:hypothetical protein